MKYIVLSMNQNIVGKQPVRVVFVSVSMSSFFICKKNEIDLRLHALVKTSSSDDGWTHFYVDETTNEKWLLTTFHAEHHGGGIPVLKRLPLPATEELIDMAVTSADTNNITGASAELLEREKNNKEDFRSLLIHRLLQFDIPNLARFDKERLRTIIYESELYDATNRRDITGKHFTEINADANYYQTISQQANAILADIDNCEC